ncbi:hypothetical protein HK100_008040, partial [Physocladia obscura]
PCAYPDNDDDDDDADADTGADRSCSPPNPATASCAFTRATASRSSTTSPGSSLIAVAVAVAVGADAMRIISGGDSGDIDADGDTGGGDIDDDGVGVNPTAAVSMAVPVSPMTTDTAAVVIAPTAPSVRIDPCVSAEEPVHPPLPIYMTPLNTGVTIREMQRQIELGMGSERRWSSESSSSSSNMNLSSNNATIGGSSSGGGGGGGGGSIGYLNGNGRRISHLPHERAPAAGSEADDVLGFMSAAFESVFWGPYYNNAGTAGGGSGSGGGGAGAGNVSGGGLGSGGFGGFRGRWGANGGGGLVGIGGGGSGGGGGGLAEGYSYANNSSDFTAGVRVLLGTNAAHLAHMAQLVAFTKQRAEAEDTTARTLDGLAASFSATTSAASLRPSSLSNKPAFVDPASCASILPANARYASIVKLTAQAHKAHATLLRLNVVDPVATFHNKYQRLLDSRKQEFDHSRIAYAKAIALIERKRLPYLQAVARLNSDTDNTNDNSDSPNPDPNLDNNNNNNNNISYSQPLPSTKRSSFYSYSNYTNSQQQQPQQQQVPAPSLPTLKREFLKAIKDGEHARSALEFRILDFLAFSRGVFDIFNIDVIGPKTAIKRVTDALNPIQKHTEFHYFRLIILRDAFSAIEHAQLSFLDTVANLYAPTPERPQSSPPTPNNQNRYPHQQQQQQQQQQQKASAFPAPDPFRSLPEIAHALQTGTSRIPPIIFSATDPVQAFGIELDVLATATGESIPPFVRKCVAALNESLIMRKTKHSIDAWIPGASRRSSTSSSSSSGSTNTVFAGGVSEWLKELPSVQVLRMESNASVGGVLIHYTRFQRESSSVIASALKLFLIELPTPIVPPDVYDTIKTVYDASAAVVSGGGSSGADGGGNDTTPVIVVAGGVGVVEEELEGEVRLKTVANLLSTLSVAHYDTLRLVMGLLDR